MLDLESENKAQMLLAAAIALAIAKVAQLVYRIYFHPLARFPGPRAAAISRSWQARQVSDGFPEVVYERLHREYGTKALRIGPKQLHLSDVNLYKRIYSQTNPFPKEPAFYECFKTPHTLFVETDPTLHKERRKLLNPLFSRAGVQKLEPVIVDKIHEVDAKIRNIYKAGPVETSNMFRCMTVDIISELAFGKSLGLINEKSTSFEADFLNAFDIAGPAVYNMYYSWVQRAASSVVPLSLVARFDRGLQQLLNLQNVAKLSLIDYMKRSSTSTHPVMFDCLKSVPKELQMSESMDILIAGSDTTASTLATGIHHILSNKAVHKQLLEAIDRAIPKQASLPTYTELEQIEYLSACVKESLRLAMPVPGMLPRIVPNTGEPLVVDGKVVAPGTIVGMSAYTMNLSAELWGQDAADFKPERWIGEGVKRLDAAMCTFSKGSRQCIGINFANAEIVITMAYLFRHFDMELVTKGLHCKDVFTQQILPPGVLVQFSPR